jgi:hypothetical protein
LATVLRRVDLDCGGRFASALHDRISVAGPEIVGVRLTQAAYPHGLALALSEKVELARPTGVGRAAATYIVPIEGRDEWLAAARREA